MMALANLIELLGTHELAVDIAVTNGSAGSIDPLTIEVAVHPIQPTRITNDDQVDNNTVLDTCSDHAVNVPLVVSTCLVTPPAVVVVIVPVNDTGRAAPG